MITTAFEISSNYLQYLLPIATGLKDVYPQKKSPFKNLAWILVLIAIQRYGTMAIKTVTQKLRPNGKNRESFPSGHMMIAAQCLTRSFKRDGIHSPIFFLNAAGFICIGLGRYLPGQHDIIDLTAGASLGGCLGCLWSYVVE